MNENRKRGKRAIDTLKIYTTIAGDLSDATFKAIVASYLADLLHACDTQGVDFKDALLRGFQHYSEEVQDVVRQNKQIEAPVPDGDKEKNNA